MKFTPFLPTPARMAGTALLAAAAVLPVRADYQSTVLSQGPVGYWRLNESTQPPPPITTAVNTGSLGGAASVGGSLATIASSSASRLRFCNVLAGNGSPKPSLKNSAA